MESEVIGRAAALDVQSHLRRCEAYLLFEINGQLAKAGKWHKSLLRGTVPVAIWFQPVQREANARVIDREIIKRTVEKHNEGCLCVESQVEVEKFAGIVTREQLVERPLHQLLTSRLILRLEAGQRDDTRRTYLRFMGRAVLHPMA